jgi:hypothetical protein
MNPAIYQLKLFEDSSLVSVADQIGLWDHAVKRSQPVLAGRAGSRDAGVRRSRN